MPTINHPYFGECEEVQERLGGCVGEVPDPAEPRNGTLYWHKVVANLVAPQASFIVGFMNKTQCGRVYTKWVMDNQPANVAPCPGCWP